MWFLEVWDEEKQCWIVEDGRNATITTPDPLLIKMNEKTDGRHYRVIAILDER